MTNAELAILSLIAEAPRFGYEIEQIIEQRGMRDWTEIGFSSIYYTLKKLQQKHLIQTIEAPDLSKGPSRNVFALTEHGRLVWKEAALQMLSDPQRAHRDLDIGLANLPGLDREEAIQHLELYAISLEERLDGIKAKASLPQNQILHVSIMFDLAISQVASELDWLRRSIKRLKESRNNENSTNL